MQLNLIEHTPGRAGPGRVSTLYNLQPAEALYFNQQQRGSLGVGVEFISIYLSIRYVKGGEGGLIQISYNAAKLNYSHEMVRTKHFLKCLVWH